MVTDTISDFLTRIRNASLRKSQTVAVPFTKSTYKIAEILEKEGFIESFQKSENEINDSQFLIKLKYVGRENKPCITNLQRLSKPGKRIYSNAKDLPRVLGGIGILILSTSSGFMTDRQARGKRIGGEIICSIW